MLKKKDIKALYTRCTELYKKKKKKTGLESTVWYVSLSLSCVCKFGLQWKLMHTLARSPKSH